MISFDLKKYRIFYISRWNGFYVTVLNVGFQLVVSYCGSMCLLVMCIQKCLHILHHVEASQRFVWFELIVFRCI